MKNLNYFYFTYSNSGTQHCRGGHFKIKAENWIHARYLYIKIFGGCAFAFQYNEEEWKRISEHGFNEECHGEYSEQDGDCAPHDVEL